MGRRSLLGAKPGWVMKVSRQGIIEIASHEAIVDMPYRAFTALLTRFSKVARSAVKIPKISRSEAA